MGEAMSKQTDSLFVLAIFLMVVLNGCQDGCTSARVTELEKHIKHEVVDNE